MSRSSGLRDAGVALGLLALAGTAQAAVPRLLVFLHVAAKQRALQGELESALAGVEVVAVGRVADFERALKSGFDAVLSLPVVLAANHLNADVRGHRQGAPEEKYSLVASETTPDASRIGSIGALDLLGREGTTDFVHGLLGSKPRVERVTKVEDLLPLLQMRRVDAILLPSRFFQDMRAASRLALSQWELPKRVGLPAAAKTGPLGAQVLSALGRMPQAANRTLGVDEWR